MVLFVILHMMFTFQVTNPAIDPLREGLVMSLEVNIGKRGNILEVGPQNVSQVRMLEFWILCSFRNIWLLQAFIFIKTCDFMCRLFCLVLY